ncbi:hypothetical protein P171DRAFT_351878 [Karstenula rhodostoma CBS 690.94]|uniref:AGC-kinase C-terminal domain-containing protein n=1 Tax=Karstenula rhodostoma CBS 690.94 TaxID=1392251 RepID=A0A9P4UHB7_9PLEO|nr:hypothetical protein P171DRAFT_351878 [Karstenula rhodostoma CBS 690.94]
MAPFFSTKRNAAKRNAASLASPEPVSSPPPYPLSSPAHSGTDYDSLSSPRLAENNNTNNNNNNASSSPVSPYPPQLPPIPRVASKLSKGGNSSLLSPQHVASHDARSPPATSPQAGRQRPALRPLGQSLAQVVERTMQAQRPPTAPSSTHHSSHSVTSSNHSSFSRSQTSLMSGLSEKLSSTSKPSTPSAQPPKASKSRLRNPMSLLLRRRSVQPLEALHDEALVTQRSPPIVPPIPDNYDPSIRGRIVHDFSAPRPNRNFSYNNAYGTEQQKSEPSPPKIEREHTPVFTEHFDDDTSYEQSQAAIRAEQLANNDFLKRNSFIPEPPGYSPPAPPSQDVGKRSSYLAEPPARTPPPPPPVPKDSPTLPPPQSALPQPPPAEANQDYASFVLSPVQEAPSPTSPTDVSAEVTPRKRKSTKTPPSSRSRAASMTDPSFVPAGLPKHLTSRASRFSFQIGGGESAAQEKMMEQRHIQKAAEKASKSEARMSTNSIGDDYDEYGMDDDYDMDGGYEEEIPMIGEEDEFGGGLGDQMLSAGMGAFDFSSLSMQPNMSSLGMNGEMSTPIDANGDRIGFAMSEETFQPMDPSAAGSFLGLGQTQMENVQGLGLMNLPQGQVPAGNFTPDESPVDGPVQRTKSVTFAQAGLGDDLYFDDGLIDEQGDVEAADFDEEVFDDPEGPLFDRKVKPPPAEELHNALVSHPLEKLSSETGYEADNDTLSKHLEISEPSLMHKTSMAQPKSDRNLNAYHSALAEAANRAEAEGRFARKASVDVGRPSSDADDSSSISNSRPSLVPDDGRFSQDTTGFPPEDDAFGMSSSFDDYDYSEYDDLMDDDMMIAEANSEALANDYEGFYGQEFGFYAGPQGEAVNAYGGYFGPSGLGRTVSGRNAMREPNLTPITERSEYSTRNSFISVRNLGDGTNSITSPGFMGQSLTSPALAQLARISPYGWRDEEDMSLDALMRLRKGAFGSTASLPGGSPGTSPRNSSPMGMQFVPRTASPAGNRMRQHNEDSFESDGSAAILESLDESEEDDNALAHSGHSDFGDGVLDDDDAYEDRPDSPTLTASDYVSLSSPTGMPTTSPATPSNAWRAGHSRKGSAADSVAYVREHDECGEGRWVLERRRTAESGELELVGREVVEGGRI